MLILCVNSANQNGFDPHEILVEILRLISHAKTDQRLVTVATRGLDLADIAFKRSPPLQSTAGRFCSVRRGKHSDLWRSGFP